MQHKMAAFYCYLCRLLNTVNDEYYKEVIVLKQIEVKNNQQQEILDKTIKKIKLSYIKE